MCGRYTIAKQLQFLEERFDISALDPISLPRYNIAPGQAVPAIIDMGEGPQLRMMRWGLVPSWAKDPLIGNRMINARAETVATKPSFRTPLQRRRCLVPADSFYEWSVGPDGRSKTPFRILLQSGELFAFAGLWDRWQKDEQDHLESCTIITTEANRFMAPIHHRMPVILSREDERVWLDSARGADGVVGLLRPAPEDQLRAYAVSKFVNSPRNDSEVCIQAMTN